MNHSGNIFVLAALAALLSTSALAAIGNLKDMDDGSQVSLNGTVEDVDNERKFTMRDATGTIDVNIRSGQSLVLKAGDRVAVSGVVDRGVLDTNIDATNVTVQKNVAEAVGEAIESRTALSLDDAAAYNIGSLPRQGLVKVSGMVTDVDNEKKFTVQDATGSIKVDVESSQNAALTRGAEVTVIGYVDSGVFTRELEAQKVMVVSDANTASAQ